MASASAATKTAATKTAATVSQIVSRPYLHVIRKPMDLRELSPHTAPGYDSESLTQTTGYQTSTTKTDQTTDTFGINAEVSGTYGFSEISSVTFKAGLSYEHSSSSSTTDFTSLQTSTTTTSNYNFPYGENIGYYQWAVRLKRGSMKTAVLFLSGPIALSPDRIKDMEDNAEPVVLHGIKGTPSTTINADSKVRWEIKVTLSQPEGLIKEGVEITQILNPLSLITDGWVADKIFRAKVTIRSTADESDVLLNQEFCGDTCGGGKTKPLSLYWKWVSKVEGKIYPGFGKKNDTWTTSMLTRKEASDMFLFEGLK